MLKSLSSEGDPDEAYGSWSVQHGLGLWSLSPFEQSNNMENIPIHSLTGSFYLFLSTSL